MRSLKITQTITNHTSNLDRYLEEIKKYDLLTTEEEVELAKKIKQGDKVALDRLIHCNLRFVVSVAKFYEGNGFTLPDLIEEGNIGLIKAAQRFDETRGFKFISYAVREIRKYIMLALGEDAKIVRLPANALRDLSKIDKFTIAFLQQNERQPISEELCEALQISTPMEKTLRQKGEKHFSLSQPVVLDDNDSGTHEDYIMDKDIIDPIQNISLREAFEKRFKQLKKKDVDIIKYHFGIDEYIPHTIKDTAKKFGCKSMGSVSRVKNKIKEKIKKMKNIDELKSYL